VDFVLPLIKDQVHLDVYFVISDSGGRTKLSNEFLQPNIMWTFLTHKEVSGILQGGWKISAKVWKDLPKIRADAVQGYSWN